MPRVSPFASRKAVAIFGVAGLLAAAGGAVQTAGAEGAKPPLLLEWSAPATCPKAADVEREVGRLLGGAPFADDEPLRARANVAPMKAGRWRVELTTEGRSDGERTLTGGSCREIADATALILALAIDPSRVAQSSPSTPTPSASVGVAEPSPATPPAPSASASSSAGESPSASAPPTPAPAPSPVPTSPPSPVVTSSPPAERFALAALVGLDTASFPHPAGSLGVAFAWRPTRWRIEASASVFPLSTGSAGGSGGDFRLVAGGVRACFEQPVGSFTFGPCAGGELGAWFSSGFGVTSSVDQTRAWGGVFGGGLATYRFSAPLALRLSLDALFPVDRPIFVLQGSGFSHQAAAVSLRTWGGVELRF